MFRSFFKVGLVILILLGLVTCGEKRPLPTGPVDSGPQLAAGDTVYTRVKPDWPAAGENLADPRDLIVNRDGYIFVADKGNARVLVFNKSGTILETEDSFGNKNFDALRDIPNFVQAGEVVRPTGVAADARMNVFITDSTNTVYVWNQFINNTGIDSIATSFTLLDTLTGQTRTVSAEQYYQSKSADEIIDETTWEAHQVMIDSLLTPRMFFSSQVPDMVSENYGGAPEKSKFVRVAAWDPTSLTGSTREGSIYLADNSIYKRIIRVDYRQYRLVKIPNGNTIWLHRGKFRAITVNWGTGLGYLQFPTGLHFYYMNTDPRILYTQFDPNFGAHLITLNPDAESRVLLTNTDFTEIGRFKRARDITADENGHLYVTNNRKKVVEEFSASGDFRRYIGTTEVTLDTTVTHTVIEDGDTTSVQVDSSFVRQVANAFQEPFAVASESGVVYVVDRALQKILRFKLSTDVDIGVDQQDQ